MTYTDNPNSKKGTFKRRDIDKRDFTKKPPYKKTNKKIKTDLWEEFTRYQKPTMTKNSRSVVSCQVPTLNNRMISPNPLTEGSEQID